MVNELRVALHVAVIEASIFCISLLCYSEYGPRSILGTLFMSVRALLLMHLCV